jgi:hypothetical protein
MPHLPPLPRWVRWMEARHGMVMRTAEQPGMGHGCGAAALEKAAIDGCAACGERPCTAALEKMSMFFCGDTEAEYGRALKQQAECGCGASGRTDAGILSLPL